MNFSKHFVHYNSTIVLTDKLIFSKTSVSQKRKLKREKFERKYIN